MKRIFLQKQFFMGIFIIYFLEENIIYTNIKFKIPVIGPLGSGKSSVIRRVVRKRVPLQYVYRQYSIFLLF